MKDRRKLSITKREKKSLNLQKEFLLKVIIKKKSSEYKKTLWTQKEKQEKPVKHEKKKHFIM